MKRFIISNAVFAALIILLASGCGYFNTFYNARKQFSEAERDTRAQEKQAQRQQQQQSQHPGGTATPGATPSNTPTASAEKYRKVIETSSRMLEDYPKSRWADDALFIMGVSYYRLGDMVRAERKFTELITLFPASRYVPQATAWKARTLAQQKKKDEAIALLQTGLPLMKAGPDKAGALYLMGSLLYEQERYSDAADYFKKSAEMNQPRADRLTSLYHYALAEYDQGIYGEARNAFSEVARTTREVPQAYDSWIRCSQCEVALHDNAEAEAILRRLTSGERFMDYAEDIPLELAKLAVATGRVDDGIQLYQDFIDQHPNGERRGLAFYRLALIHRDQKANLQMAKALLDSTGKSGASHDIADSAQKALDQISKGLLTMEKIKSLQADIRMLEGRLDTLGVPHSAFTDSALLAYADSIREREAALKPAKTIAQKPAETQPDSMKLAALTPALTDTMARVPETKPEIISKDTSSHIPQAVTHPAHKDSTTSSSTQVALAKEAEKQTHSTPLAQRKLSLLDSNQTWDAARSAFRAISTEDRLGLRTLTRAIETRDSARDEGNGDHEHRVQVVINRAYGIGIPVIPAATDSATAKRRAEQKHIIPDLQTHPRPDSVKTVRVTGADGIDTTATPPKQTEADTLNKPRTSNRSSSSDARFGLRGFRSTPESPGGASPDSGKRGVPVGSQPQFPSTLPDQGISQAPTLLPPAPADTSAKPARSDSALVDSTNRTEISPGSVARDSVMAAPAPTDVDQLRTQLLAKQRELQLTYLHAAEFYEFNLTEQDSAMTYYRLAAASPVNADVYWRANLYLGSVYSEMHDSLTSTSDSVRADSIPEAATHYYRAVVNADSVPVNAANEARSALKMPLIEIPLPPQVLALHEAENAQLVDGAPIDSVISLYTHVIEMDSNSTEGKRALFAKANLLEMRLHRFDQARITYERLLALSPDTAMANVARAKLAPPDSNSIFNLSDAELAGKHEAVESLLEAKQDDTGWPPSEESLRGRHYR
jgi:tetratricopeptide (TPR) repeat protein